MSLLSLLQRHLTGWSLFGKEATSLKKLDLCCFPGEFRWWSSIRLILQGSWKIPKLFGKEEIGHWYKDIKHKDVQIESDLGDLCTNFD